MGSAWICPVIVMGDVLQASGAPMNAQLKPSPQNTWLASAISFARVSTAFLAAAVVMPRPLPTAAGFQW